MESKWTSLIYQYGLGGLFFFSSLFALIRKRRSEFTDKSDIKTALQLIAGFFFFLLLHGFLIIASGRQ